MPTKISSAPRASSISNVIRWILGMALVLMGSVHAQNGLRQAQSERPELTRPHWLAVTWADLPAWGQDDWHGAWSAWLSSCSVKTQAHPALPRLCREVRTLTLASKEAQQKWLQTHFTPYRVTGSGDGLLTGYFEPELEAARSKTPQLATPLHLTPSGLQGSAIWFSRAEIDTDARAQALLAKRVIAYVADPLDALAAQIQGSVRLRLIDDLDESGQAKAIRLGFAGTNNHPYKSVGRWLLDQGLLRDASWQGIKAWARENPGRVQDMLHSNPRYVFFKQLASDQKPVGAQGVPLTDMRSIAVDPKSIPYGLPVWLATQGAQLNLSQLVMAQDTGSAIVGNVRADLFVGTGDGAGEIAGRLKQPLQMWVLSPKDSR